MKIAGVSHEFSSIDGVLEDVTDIILNIKGLVLGVEGDEPRVLTLKRSNVGEVRARDIECESAVTIADPDYLIATLTADVNLDMEMTARRGRGYATAFENRAPDQEVGVIPVDATFSPVRRVRYRTEDMRVGQRTNYDRLIMEVWTDGWIDPEDALVEAGLILRKHLNAFVMYHELGDEMVTAAEPELNVRVESDSVLDELSDKPISALNLSVRANNCLEAARVATVGELVQLSEADLLRFRSFGRTSLHEVQRKLSELGLGLVPTPGEDGAAVDDGTASASGDGGSGDVAELSDKPAEGETPASGPMEAYTMTD